MALSSVLHTPEATVRIALKNGRKGFFDVMKNARAEAALYVTSLDGAECEVLAYAEIEQVCVPFSRPIHPDAL